MNSSKTLIFTAILNFTICFADYIQLVVFALFLSSFLTVVQTTIIIGVPQVASIFLGYSSAYFEKRYGQKTCICISLLVTGLAYISYSICSHFILLLLISLIHGIFSFFLKPLIKSLFSSCVGAAMNVDFVHRIRYLTICVASIIGPYLGYRAAQYYSMRTCLVLSGCIYIVIFLLVVLLYYIFFPNLKTDCTFSEFENGYLVAGLSDLRLLLYSLIGLLVFFVFVQFENIYSLFLTNYEEPERIFSILLIINSICGILFQTIIVVFNIEIDSKKSIFLGLVFFQAGFLFFTFSFKNIAHSLIFLVLGIIVYSLGEVLTIPALDIIIDDIAPPNKKSLYFGFSEIRNLGYMLGPIFSGYVLQHLGSVYASLFSVLILALTNIIFIYTLKKFH